MVLQAGHARQHGDDTMTTNPFHEETVEQNRGPRCENHPQRKATLVDDTGEYCQECQEAIEEGRL